MPRARKPRVRLSQKVAATLSRAIIAGEFKPGTRVSEPTLSAMLGVSRAPIREALIELELRGLVDFDPTGHTRVPLLTPEDIHEIYSVRLMIDPVAASLAATNGTEKAFAAIEANISAMTSAKTLADVSRLDAEFHERIVRAAGNRRLLLCWNVLHDQVALWLGQMQLHHDALNKGTREVTIQSHCKLLDAIRSGNPQLAAEEARRHVEGWRDFIPQLLEHSPAKD